MIFNSVHDLYKRIEHLEKSKYRNSYIIKFYESAEFKNFISKLKEDFIYRDKKYLRMQWDDNDVIDYIFCPYDERGEIICTKASVFDAVFEAADPKDFYYFNSKEGEIPYYSVSVDYNGLTFKCAEELIDDAYIIKLKNK